MEWDGVLIWLLALPLTYHGFCSTEEEHKVKGKDKGILSKVNS